ncbi:hypothetical protein MC885_015179, partial [Smutsia gigantea]
EGRVASTATLGTGTSTEVSKSLHGADTPKDGILNLGILNLLSLLDTSLSPRDGHLALRELQAHLGRLQVQVGRWELNGEVTGFDVGLDGGQAHLGLGLWQGYVHRGLCGLAWRRHAKGWHFELGHFEPALSGGYLLACQGQVTLQLGTRHLDVHLWTVESHFSSHVHARTFDIHTGALDDPAGTLDVHAGALDVHLGHLDAGHLHLGQVSCESGSCFCLLELCPRHLDLREGQAHLGRLDVQVGRWELNGEVTGFDVGLDGGQAQLGLGLWQGPIHRGLCGLAWCRHAKGRHLELGHSELAVSGGHVLACQGQVTLQLGTWHLDVHLHAEGRHLELGYFELPVSGGHLLVSQGQVQLRPLDVHPGALHVYLGHLDAGHLHLGQVSCESGSCFCLLELCPRHPALRELQAHLGCLQVALDPGPFRFVLQIRYHHHSPGEGHLQLCPRQVCIS